MIAFSALQATFSANDPPRALPLGRHLFGTVGNNYGGASLAVVGGRSIGFQMPNRKERTSPPVAFQHRLHLLNQSAQVELKQCLVGLCDDLSRLLFQNRTD
jgi:hypothetical protein